METGTGLFFLAVAVLLVGFKLIDHMQDALELERKRLEHYDNE